MKALLTVLFLCITANAQAREEFHNRYGSPTSETFTVRPGVFVTVTYASRVGQASSLSSSSPTDTGEVCEMIIHSQQLTSGLDYPITKTMQSQELTQIIDDLVPVKLRGKPLMGGFLNLRCLPLDNCAGAIENYERVTIIRIGGDNKRALRKD